MKIFSIDYTMIDWKIDVNLKYQRIAPRELWRNGQWISFLFESSSHQGLNSSLYLCYLRWTDSFHRSKDWIQRSFKYACD